MKVFRCIIKKARNAEKNGRTRLVFQEEFVILFIRDGVIRNAVKINLISGGKTYAKSIFAAMGIYP